MLEMKRWKTSWKVWFIAKKYIIVIKTTSKQTREPRWQNFRENAINIFEQISQVRGDCEKMKKKRKNLRSLNASR